MHGEYISKGDSIMVQIGSPPYARGIRSTDYPKLSPGGITPVCTGNTDRLLAMGEYLEDHPRMHGEY